MSRREEILSLPKMNDIPQIEWLMDNNILQSHKELDTGYRVWESLADCAFRLRDEYFGVNFLCAVIEVCKYACKLDMEAVSAYCWLINTAKPIHWICAALLAKE